MEFSLSHNMNKVWEIVTDSEKWYFMKYMLDNEGKPSFNTS
jgi:hypothetical protein